MRYLEGVRVVRVHGDAHGHANPDSPQQGLEASKSPHGLVEDDPQTVVPRTGIEVVMGAALIGSVATWFVLVGSAVTTCFAQTVIDADFSRGDLAALDWKAKGDWGVFTYPKESANNPGAVARFAANKPEGSLTRTFAEIKNPKKVTLSLDYGWGWGDAGQGADAVSFMLLDSRGNGYVFEVHRVKATWAVQWARVAEGIPHNEKTWASEAIDATHAS